MIEVKFVAPSPLPPSLTSEHTVARCAEHVDTVGACAGLGSQTKTVLRNGTSLNMLVIELL